jgi:hypothetical protein
MVGGLDPWSYGGRQEHVEVAAGKAKKIVAVFGLSDCSASRMINEHGTRGLPWLSLRPVTLQGRREDLQKHKQYRCIVDTVG